MEYDDVRRTDKVNDVKNRASIARTLGSWFEFRSRLGCLCWSTARSSENYAKQHVNGKWSHLRGSGWPLFLPWGRMPWPSPCRAGSSEKLHRSLSTQSCRSILKQEIYYRRAIILKGTFFVQRNNRDPFRAKNQERTDIASRGLPARRFRPYAWNGNRISWFWG